MKKLFLSLVALVAFSLSASADAVTIYLSNNHIVEGMYVYSNDTSLVVRPSKNATDVVTFIPSVVDKFYVSGIGRFLVKDGKFTPDASTLYNIEKHAAKRAAKAEELRARAADPNLEIGKALQTAGTTSLAIGVPTLVVGAILVGVGHSESGLYGKSADEIAEIVKSRDRCRSAGYVLLPMGAALTIVGIPLYVRGKRVAEMSVNYLGTGVGMAFNF